MAIALNYRPCREPTARLPFGVRSVGRYCVPEGWSETPQQKSFVQIFWGVRGKGELALPGFRRVLGAGELALYLPGDTHAIRTCEGEWEYAWWTLDGPLAESVVRGFGFDGREPKAVGRLPEEAFGRLFGRVASSDRADEIANAALAYELLARAAGLVGTPSSEETPSLAERCRDVFNAEFADPSVSVKTVAVRLRTDRSYLSRLFRKECGIPPKTYLRRLRVGKALALLRSTETPVAQIALQSGFDSPSYFASVIHQITGYAPAAFRSRHADVVETEGAAPGGYASTRRPKSIFTTRSAAGK